MADKKSVSRFCIQFNVNDSRHLQVMNILNAQGRHKAQYIASAVLHYINCTETPSLPQDDAAFRQAVEAIVADVMKKHSRPTETPPQNGAENGTKKKLRQSAEIGVDDTELDESTIGAIHDALAAFRSGE